MVIHWHQDRVAIQFGEGTMVERNVRVHGQVNEVMSEKTVGKAKLSYDELLIVIPEVEMVNNSRPLSYVSTEDVEEPLTPSHLLIGRRILSLPDALCHGDVDDAEVMPTCLMQRMKYVNFHPNP